MRTRYVVTLVVIGLLAVACDRTPDDPKKPTPPDPTPVPAPQASTSGSGAVAATQPAIVPSAATRQRGPDTPAVGSVQQPERRPGGDANPQVTTPTGTGVGR